MQTATTNDTGEHRAHQRFPLWTDVALEGAGGEAGAGATLIDLSAGGALVKLAPEVERPLDGRIRIPCRDESQTLAYDVVATVSSWEGTLLHIEFKDADAGGKVVAQLLGELESESTDMQRWIASGHGLLGRVSEREYRRIRVS